jgi:magnesium-transporting ATPase (P-type)
MRFLTTLAQMYENSYSTSTNLDSGTSAAYEVGVILFIFVFTLALYAISSYLFSRIFKKAGVKPWIAWVPIYNSWKLLEIGGQKGYWAVLALFPLVNIIAIVFMYIAMYNIGLKLGQQGVFILLAIFIPIVWIIWLAFDKSTWDDSKGAPSLAQLEAPTAPTSTPTPTPPAAQAA